MEEYTKDCEFWLPSQFLTDDDILSGFKNENKNHFGCDFKKEFSYGFNMSGPGSPVESVVGSPEPESDEEDYITELTRQMVHSTLETHKGWGLSRSPQSTLCGERPNYPSMAKEMKSRKEAVDLLYAAVGEVARMKMMEEGGNFCRNKTGIWAPTRKKSSPNLGSFYSNQSPLSYHHLQMAQLQRMKQQEEFWEYQEMARGRDRNGATWLAPPQHHHQHPLPPPAGQPGLGKRVVFHPNAGTKRECAGTGVFIPRTQTKTRKKPGCPTVLLPDRVVQALNLNLDAMEAPPHLHAHIKCNGDALKYRNNVAEQETRNLKTQPAAMPQELLLPQDWTY